MTTYHRKCDTLRAIGEVARDGHEQCESDKNWLRAQRDVAEQKLKEALAVSRADLSVGGHDGRGSETSAEGRSESHDARLGRDAEVSSVRQTDGAVDCARDIPADSHLPLVQAAPVAVSLDPHRLQDTYPWGETMSQYAALGIGAEAWVELQELERRGIAQRNNDKSGMSISWRTLKLVMTVLRAIRIEDFVAARLRGEATVRVEE